MQCPCVAKDLLRNSPQLHEHLASETVSILRGYLCDSILDICYTGSHLLILSHGMRLDGR
jgi:hypothetical protein